MKPFRLWLTLTGLGMLLLSACAQRTPTPTATHAPSPSPQPPTATTPPTATLTATTLPATGKMTCTMESAILPTPNATEASLFPPVSEQDWVQGPPDAAVTIVEYGDFQ